MNIGTVVDMRYTGFSNTIDFITVISYDEIPIILMRRFWTGCSLSSLWEEKNSLPQLGKTMWKRSGYDDLIDILEEW